MCTNLKGGQTSGYLKRGMQETCQVARCEKNSGRSLHSGEHSVDVEENSLCEWVSNASAADSDRAYGTAQCSSFSVTPSALVVGERAFKISDPVGELDLRGSGDPEVDNVLDFIHRRTFLEASIMFEAHVLHLLRRYLGEYVRGLSVEALKISVWKGDVVLKDLQLKAEALNALKLPITVKAGFLGSVTLKVPWNRLGKEPVIVLLDRIFVLAEPLQDEHSSKREDKESWLESKRRRIEEKELAYLEAKDKKTPTPDDAPETSTWLGSLIATIVGNLKISITNLHIRYEDTLSNQGHPFCSGVTLAKLAAVTVDETGNETFVTSGALERLRKKLELERLAVYHDSNSSPWKPEKEWEELTPTEWSEIFEAGISSDVPADVESSRWASDRKFLLHPVDGSMRYHRRGKRESREPHIPFQKASLRLDQVSATVSESQYCDGMKLLEGVSRYRTRMQFSHLRPKLPVSEDAQAWWLYACQAVLQQQSKMWYRLSWKKLVDVCERRRKYVRLYAAYLQQSPRVDNEEIRLMDKELDSEVVVLWRLLAHAKVESAKSKAEAAVQRERVKKNSWWSFGWGGVDGNRSSNNAGMKGEAESAVPGQLTKEEWNKINELLSYKPDEDLSLSRPEAPNMLQTALEVSVGRSAASLLDKEGTEILCGTFENLQISLMRYPKTEKCDVQLKYYGLSAPEGRLIESVSREGRDHALTTTFVLSPIEEPLEWKLSAAMSPCHVTIWRTSFDRFLKFLKSSQELSPGVALETAAVLQSKLEEVTRRAQEQLQLVLEERRRFHVHLDLDAPKIAIPAEALESGGEGTQLLLDLGHFTLETALEEDHDIERPGLYSRFYISGSDISAFLVDGPFDWSELPPANNTVSLMQGLESPESADSHLKPGRLILPVLDRCGMSVVLDQIQVQHPSFPSTRLQIKVPHLGLHFSPGRYRRMLLLLRAIEGTDQVSEGAEGPTAVAFTASHSADFSGEACILLWGGIGHTVAEWQPCWVVLSGSYLYILESENAQSYQRCTSVVGKQALEVPRTSIGGYDYVVGIFHRGVDVGKGIESSHAVLLQLKTKELQAAWLKQLTRATYKASVPVSLLLPLALTEDGSDDTEVDSVDLHKQPHLLVMGSLDELQLSVYGSSHRAAFSGRQSAGDETLIMRMEATGGKVDLLQRQYDMLIRTKLHSLKIEDELQGHVGPSCRYIARSVISVNNSDTLDATEKQISWSPESLPPLNLTVDEDDDDDFDDALPDFGSPHSSISAPQSPSSSFRFATSAKLEASSSEKSLPHWGLDQLSAIKAEQLLDEIFNEHEEVEVSDFVNVRLIIRHKESVDYDGTDTQMSIRMATLDFFCNRPTVVAIIDFGSELNEVMDMDSAASKNADSLSPVSSGEDVAVVTVETLERNIVKGLLGRGKSRVIFRLRMDMESARIYLNKEDGSQLAMLAQEKFMMDLKVYPGSFTIASTLGNWRVCDTLLGPDHRWGWLFDIRDPGCRSLVELEFHSFSKDDDDFQGYDYSLTGKFSAVRIVFLYRFIQEIQAYFYALATPQVQQVITVVDKVGGIEKLIQQSDIEGGPAIKLNLSFDTPIIIMPRNSGSHEFMHMDLGHLEVFNTFHWHGGDKSEPSAVHIDVLSAEITDINMVVGIDGEPGKPMIDEASRIHVTVRRPLRDLFKKVPELQVDVQVDILCGVMSDKEYLVIIDCASANVSEPPNLPPTFREDTGESWAGNQEFMNLEPAQEVDEPTQPSNNGGQGVSSWTKSRWNVDIRQVELELYNGVEREFPLARLEIQNFWLSYCTTTAQEMDIYVTLPRLSVVDLRADTKPEMRLMLGSVSDVDRLSASDVRVTGIGGEGSRSMQSENSTSPELTMLVMDMRYKRDSQTVVIRVQRPRLLVVVDFLLAVGEFFVPSLASITGRDEAMDVSNDPVILHDYIRLNDSTYTQVEDTVVLSAERQLVADAHDVDEFLYDGDGKTLFLDVSEDIRSYPGVDQDPLIFVGRFKHLRFKNIRIKNGFWLSKCVYLSSDSSYSAALEDGVILEGSEDSLEIMASPTAISRGKSLRISASQNASEDSNFVLDVQAVSPELTFYDSTKWPPGSLAQRERLLRAKLSFNVMYASKGSDKWIKGNVKSLTIEGGSGIVVVDPLDLSAEYAHRPEKTSLLVTSSDISTRLSYNVISLVLRIHQDAMSTFYFRDAYPVLPCTHFDRIWVTNSGINSSQQITIWRPRAPAGYAILSDCAVSGISPPSQAVMAVSKSYRRVKKPLGFELLWSTHSEVELGTEESSLQDSSSDNTDTWSVWLPIAPPGYSAVGCAVERGATPPVLSIVHCIRSDLVTSGSITDCIYSLAPGNREDHKTGCSFWRVENAVGSFYAHSSVDPPPKSFVSDLREVLRYGLDSGGSETVKTETPAPVDSSSSKRRLEKRPSSSRLDSFSDSPSKSGRSCITTAHFERMWWDKGSKTRRIVSIWRPIPPPGYAIIGDCLVEGLEPPTFGITLREGNSGSLARPVKYLQRMHTSGKGFEDVYIWFPVAPTGYVAMGCIATKSRTMPSTDLIRCVRTDNVMQINFSKKPLWSLSTEKGATSVWNLGANRGGYSCSLWKVENQANTFIARPDLRRPPGRMAYSLSEIGKRRLRDNLVAEVQTGRLSATVYDDLSGMMTPVMDMTVTGINLAANGRAESFNVVVVAAFAASTFNMRLEAWEPLIEPFDGVIKYESHGATTEAALKIGKRFRISAANVVNVNVTSAAVDTLVGAVLAWRKQAEFEEKARMVMQVDERADDDMDNSILSSALEEEDLEKVIVENSLGSELYLRTFKENFQKVTVLSDGDTSFVRLPPPKFPDKFMTGSDTRPIRHYVLVHVAEAKDLVVNDDGNGQEYLCALRVAAARPSTEAQKAPPQSARSRCVRPSSLTQGTNTLLATVKWNEMFLFEVSKQGSASLEVVVTNMAAKAGKGQAIGAVSIPIEDNSASRDNLSSLWDIVKQSVVRRSSMPDVYVKTFTLHPRKRDTSSAAAMPSSGSISVSLFFFTSASNQLASEEGGSGFQKEEVLGSDIGLWLSANPEGPWTGLRSVLTLGTVPRQIGDQHLAVEVTMQQGLKHVKVRSLVMVVNKTDIDLSVCICPLSLLNTPDGGRSAADEPDTVTEEIFENQRFQPLAGWGSKWPGHLMPTDPGRWSSRDYSASSQEFSELRLPPGWIWTSQWALDKSGFVDLDGWFYGADFQSLKALPTSPKSSKKSTFDFARRRRWLRTRQRVPESTFVRTRHVISMVQPGESISVPWSSVDAKTDFCVQVRPHSDPVQYSWGRALVDASPSNNGRSSEEGSQSGSRTGTRLTSNGVPVSSFLLNQLEKTEELLLCLPASGSGSKGLCWLNMEADANILCTELNVPVYDWRLSVNAPLKLENRLPCKAEFIIWEKSREGNLVRRHQDVINAGASVYLHFVDVRRAVFLTWLAQGGWKPEKDVVLISDPSAESLPSGFFIVHQQNGRKLRVSLENDFGSTAGSAKIVRLFVPYWLCNDANLPLNYRLVEIEPSGGGSGDTSWLTRAAKAAKQAARRPARAGEVSKSHLHKVVQSIELLEQLSGVPVMLSLQAQSDRIGGLSLANNSEGGRLSPRLGLSVTVGSNTRCDSALSFRDFEENMEWVDFKAVDGTGAYYKLSAFLDMSSDRTKVVHLQPHTVFVNRLGQTLRLRQADTEREEVIYPNDAARTILWQSTSEPELLSVSLDGYKCSQTFSIESEGIMRIILQGEGRNPFVLQIEVRSGVKGSRLLVIFRRASLIGAYRIENRSEVLPFRYRQADGSADSWQLLQPGFAASFAWEDLQRERLLELLVDGADQLTARKVCIDEVAEIQPMPTRGVPVAALTVRVSKEGSLKVVRISDWKPSDLDLSIIPSSAAGSSPKVLEPSPAVSGSENQFHAFLEVAELGISVVDHTPEELLYITMQNLILSYATGLGSGTNRYKFRVDGLQIDNQLPLTPMPVLFSPQDSGNRPEFLLKLTATTKDEGLPDRYSFPYIGIQGPSIPAVAFLVRIPEPIIWRLHEMFKQWNLQRLTTSQTTDVAIDPNIRIGLLHTTEIRFKVTLAMSPTQRPRGMLGFWSTLMTSLGNTDEMPIRITPRVHEEMTMRQSALFAAAISSIRNDVLSQPFALLSGVDILGNASTAFGHMSKGVAALSMDKKFIRSRQKQDSKATVEDIGDGLREGGEALAKGFFRGVTGILTKPLEGARSSGVEGFVQGVGKGVIGAAIQPMSGMLDFLSRTTEGANATRMKLTAAITFEEVLVRRRLPRVIGGDNVLRPYDEYKARGQVLMQLAERGAIFGPIDLFKVRGKFAMSDAYEDHFNLPKGRTLMITHRRIIMLQHPTGVIVQKRADLLKDPCTVTWDVTWDDFMTMELAHGKEEPLSLPPSRLIIHLRNWSQDTRLFDSKEIARIVKCHPGTKQAVEIRLAIQKAYDAYGPNRASSSQGGLSRRPSVKKPYAAAGAGAASGAALGLLAGPAAPIAVPVMATFGALIGGAGSAMLESESELPPAENIRSARGSVGDSSLRSDSTGRVQVGKFINEFELMWWDKGAPWSKKFQVSIWRPVPPAGFISVGDVVQRCYDPPDSAMVYKDEHDGKFAMPDGFDLVWRDTESGAREPVTIWRPRAPTGYTVIGCVVVPDYCEPDREVLRCVRKDCVGNVPLGQVPLWRDYNGSALWHCSLWQVQNDAHTFLARRDHQPPPPNLAYTVLP
ncbi:hypothetical protein R1flu_025391 [Riccia fluitans]|uniref:C2 domain-containing protein n=1 Tax=Riccia fluitans TaxID=41844 RepID=A0ABD1XXL9_9MARC